MIMNLTMKHFFLSAALLLCVAAASAQPSRRGDPRIEHTRKAAEALKAAGAKVHFTAWPGGHEWQPWRKSLHEFVQLLFK